jgi:hypothetical protein
MNFDDARANPERGTKVVNCDLQWKYHYFIFEFGDLKLKFEEQQSQTCRSNQRASGMYTDNI